MPTCILPNRWTNLDYQNAPPATLSLFGITERRSKPLNLNSGMYELILTLSDCSIGSVKSAYLQAETTREGTNDVRSYSALMPPEANDDQSMDTYSFIWDKGFFGESYSSTSQPMAYARQLLPFEKIELMFSMNMFLKVSEEWQRLGESNEPLWSKRNFDLCYAMWKKGNH